MKEEEDKEEEDSLLLSPPTATEQQLLLALKGGAKHSRGNVPCSHSDHFSCHLPDIEDVTLNPKRVGRDGNERRALSEELGLDSFHRQHDERGRTRAESDDFFPRVSKEMRVLLQPRFVGGKRWKEDVERRSVLCFGNENDVLSKVRRRNHHVRRGMHVTVSVCSSVGARSARERFDFHHRYRRRRK